MKFLITIEPNNFGWVQFTSTMESIQNIKDWNNLIQLAERGDTSAMNEASMHYRDGLKIGGTTLVEMDEKLSFSWARKSYEKGDLEGMISYADWISDPNSQMSEYEPDKAIKIYKEAIAQGAIHANHNLGIEYRNKGEFQTAFECYRKAGGADGFRRDLSIGLCYYYGIGTPKDKNKAFEIFSTLKEEECTGYEFNEVNYLLGKMYLDGDTLEKDIAKAREYLELADEDGDHRSALELLYIIGRTQVEK